MSRSLIVVLFLGLIVNSFRVFGQDKPGKIEITEIQDRQKADLKKRIQTNYVEALNIGIDEFLSKVASASGARMASTMSIPLTCVPKGQTPAPPAPPLAQYQALLNLYSSTGGANWNQKEGWLGAPATPVPVHNWSGVCVNALGHVIGLDLSGFGLQGGLPATFWNLTSLVYLNLSNNGLTNGISGLGSLTQLQYLNLSSNGFSGSIPGTVSSLVSLVSLNLDGNSFTNSIPTNLFNLSNLSELVLSNNNFLGPLPVNFGNATNLVLVNLSYNQNLGGELPLSMASLTNLGAFLVAECNLDGPIPDVFSNLVSLQDLYLTGNEFEGDMPEDLGLLPNLKILSLGDNELTGEVDPGVFASTSIQYLHLYSNGFSGDLEGIGGMESLKDLVAYANQFSGPLPNAFETLTNLEVVNLAFNNFSGQVPPNFLCGTSKKSEVRIDHNPGLYGRLSDCLRFASGQVNISHANFTFSDFLHLAGPLPDSRFTYAPQGLVGDQVNVSERIGFPHIFNAEVDTDTRNPSKHRWFKLVNGAETPIQPAFSEIGGGYKIQHLTAGDFGTYYYKIINDHAPLLTLKSRNYVISQNTANLGTLGIKAYNLYCAVALEMAPNLIPGCAPISASWNFGDGGTSNKENPVHAYGSGGTYQVTLSLDFVCGESIVFTYTANKSIPFNPSTITAVKMVDKTLSAVTNTSTRTLDASFVTFSDAWDRSLSLDVDTLNGYQNGKLGLWGQKSSFFFDADRSYSAGLNIAEDGTYELGGFSHDLAPFEVIPDFIKASEVTGLSEEGFFDESMDALGIYSTQMYGYESGSVISTAVNARKAELLTFDFEDLNSPSSGNWVLGESSRSSRGRTTAAKILASGSYTVTVDKKLSDISHFDRVSLSVQYLVTPRRIILTRVEDVPVICMQANPLNANETILILDAEKSAFEGAYRAYFVNQTANPRMLLFDNQFAHSGKQSMKFTNASESITQDLVQLVPGKEYSFSAWVSDKLNSGSAISDPNQSIEVKFESRTGTLISSQKFYPQVHPIESWRKVFGNFVPPAGTERITLTFNKGASTAIWIDDIRIQPIDSQMKTFVYDTKSLRIAAVLDEENYATYYFYDEEGKLRLLKKETLAGLVTITEVQDFLVPNTTGAVKY